MEEFRLLGGCGLYCGACSHYRAFMPDSRHLLERVTADDPDFEECHGCRSDFLTDYCSKCSIRQCTSERGIAHCGLCPEYPCSLLKSFQHDGRVHHIVVLDSIENLKTRGPVQWLDEQNQRWECRCGQKFSWYEESCNRCGSPLPSYGFRHSAE
jgi:hypothetical protein